MKEKIHLFEYEHDGARWSIEIIASSEQDAVKRIAALQNGKYLGVLQFKVPVELGIFGRLICWIQNRRVDKMQSKYCQDVGSQ